MTTAIDTAFAGFLVATLRPLDGADHTTSAEEARLRWVEETWAALPGRDRVHVAECIVEAEIAAAPVVAPSLRRRSHAWAEAVWDALSPGAQFGVALVIDAGLAGDG